MKFTVRQIADLIQAEVEGDETLVIDHLDKIEDGKAGGISFLANTKYEPFLYQTGASAVIIAKDFVLEQEVAATLLRVADPYSSFTMMLEQLEAMNSPQFVGIEEGCFVASSAQLGNEVYIGAYSYVSEGAEIGDGVKIYPQVFVGANVKIGAGSILYPQSVIYRDCELGRECIIHSGARIGSDGFGFAPQADGTYRKIPQTGNVVLEDGVEVGANACLDRATMGSTLIRKGAKIDNLVQIAHNVEVGPSTVIAAQSGIAGSSKLGAGCQLGGQVGVVGHLQIADLTKVDAQSGVNRSIKQSGQAFRGSPIQPFRQQLKSEVMFRKLAEMAQKIEQLERALAQRG